MMYLTNVQNFNLKTLYFELHKNDKCGSEILSIVNNGYFQNSKHYQILSFLCRLEYKNFALPFCTLVVYIIHYIQNFFSEFFEDGKYDF
jgi:hypothetical protein